MQKKIKKPRVYVTVHDGGQDFRTIAKKMSTIHGFHMNHATARNIFIEAMTSLLKRTTTLLGTELTEKQIELLLKKQEVHESLSELLYKACYDNKK
jgi:hypothetical protein